MAGPIPKLSSKKNWSSAFQDDKFVKLLLSDVLPGYVQQCRWFAGKGSRIKNYRLDNYLPLKTSTGLAYVFWLVCFIMCSTCLHGRFLLVVRKLLS